MHHSVDLVCLVFYYVILLCQNCTKDQVHQVCIGGTAVLGSQCFFLRKTVFLGYMNFYADIVRGQDARETHRMLISTTANIASTKQTVPDYIERHS